MVDAAAEHADEGEQPEGRVEQPAGTGNQAAGTEDQAAGTEDQAAGTEDQAAGTEDQAAGTGAKPDGKTVLDQLSFLDLLYAVPIADLATRVSGANLSRVSGADWSALAVVLAVIVFSWIGLHKDRAITSAEEAHDARIGDIRFAHIEFFQFLLEIGITGMYFAMGLQLRLPDTGHGSVALPSETWLTAYLLFIFGAYSLWDCMDVWRAALANGEKWKKRALRGMIVTLAALVAFVVIYPVSRAALPSVRTETPVILVNLGLIVVMYAYRVAQDWWGNTPPSTGRQPQGARARCRSRRKVSVSPATVSE